MLGRRVAAVLLATTLIGGALTFAGASTASAAGPLTATTHGLLPDAQVLSPYSMQLVATGGVPPYTWSHDFGNLRGLSLSPSGVISGTPPPLRENTTYVDSHYFSVTDSALPPSTATTLVYIRILPLPFRITTAALPAGTVGQPYSAALAAAGGKPPFTFRKVTGMPRGLRVARKTGVISGTPQKAGAYTVVFGAKTAKSKSQPGGNPQPPPYKFATKSLVLIIH